MTTTASVTIAVWLRSMKPRNASCHDVARLITRSSTIGLEMSLYQYHDRYSPVSRTNTPAMYSHTDSVRRRRRSMATFAIASVTVSPVTIRAMPRLYQTKAMTPRHTPSAVTAPSTLAMNVGIVQPTEATADAGANPHT